jgi:hypothetical protein
MQETRLPCKKYYLRMEQGVRVNGERRLAVRE